ncbi:hypothetical protein AV521_26365 [Streptomyces sp. IMTB 2501]|uniref:hypothetical protein n=1 Tax=Streptomyces sp. IMTB 2501 TaxID=1776340 RepID=UPI00096D927C|nr:hypothetical protein [Streptomyces sp. IMTB 2501]OLZ66919.1 hypothetical protein AV521_26365 [Streptomyces sp. IMTB 2501]
MKTFRRRIPGKKSAVAAMILGAVVFVAPTATAVTENPKPQSPAFDRCVHSAGPAGRYYYPGYANVPCV